MRLQVILATAKSEAPPLFRMLAANFRHRNLAFAWFNKDAEPAVAAQLAADKVPRLLVAFVDPATKPDAQGRVPLGVQALDLPLNYKNMHAFAATVATRFAPEHEVCTLKIATLLQR